MAAGAAAFAFALLQLTQSASGWYGAALTAGVLAFLMGARLFASGERRSVFM